MFGNPMWASLITRFAMAWFNQPTRYTIASGVPNSAVSKVAVPDATAQHVA